MPDKKPQDETGGPLFGLILKPEWLHNPGFPEASSAVRVASWGPLWTSSYGTDHIVDREDQVWWPPRGDSVGYAGRWGPQVTNDPKSRRSGMRCPGFALMFLEALARL
jgi:hypothetical protein